MHMVPFISSLMRVSRSDAAIPLGCLSVLVTWLNLTTISPSSQAADAAPAVTVNARAVAAAVTNFMSVSSLGLTRSVISARRQDGRMVSHGGHALKACGGKSGLIEIIQLYQIFRDLFCAQA